tara:strand:+ start:30 stop:467 length:438 start_codon:yes stop_codon:yes gene_type:complete
MLTLTKAHTDSMISHAKETLPYEACGLLGGKPGYVNSVYLGKNSKNSSSSYLLDPIDHLHAIKHIDLRGEELIGIFHSHPSGPAFPSETDIIEAYYPEVVNIILSRYNKTKWYMRGYNIIKGKVHEVSLQVISSTIQQYVKETTS